MIRDYKDQRAVITGGANGIGREIALGMSRRGAKILIADIHGDEAEAVVKEIEAAGGKAWSIESDVSLLEDCEAIYNKTMEVLGGCDILVNNAGVSAGGDVEDIPIEDIKWVNEVNVYSHWYMMRYFLPQMKSQKNHCQIVNVSSIAGLISSASGPVYFSTKHAAVGLAETVYKQLKAQGADIDISVVCPGFVNTKMYLTNRNRPKRFAVAEDDPYYSSDKYTKFVDFNRQILEGGMSVEEAVAKIFDQLSKDQFYIFTHDGYDKLLRIQGEYIADRIRPADISDITG